MADMNDFADMNAVYAEFFTEPYPARSAVAVKTLPKGALVEIEVVNRPTTVNVVFISGTNSLNT